MVENFMFYLLYWIIMAWNISYAFHHHVENNKNIKYPSIGGGSSENLTFQLWELSLNSTIVLVYYDIHITGLTF